MAPLPVTVESVKVKFGVPDPCNMFHVILVVTGIQGGERAISKLYQAKWWQLKYFFFSPRTLGKDFPFDEHIFQRGWFNHQPAKDSSPSEVKGILAAPPKATPTRNKGLIRPY